MIRKPFSLLFFVLLISTCDQIEESNTETRIKAYLDNISEDDFSGVILVAMKDSILEKRAYSYANIENKIKNQFDTKFNIASISKMITAVGILKLYDKGKVDLHEPIGKYLPNYPNETVKNQVTIHQLLSHTSGLNNFYVEDKFLESDKLQYKNLTDFTSLFSNEPLASEPGAAYNYSASGYVVLGMIIEKISGQNYYDYIYKSVFEPAHMYNSIAPEIDSIVENKADGYTSYFGESKILKKNDYYLSKTSSAGFHYSTAEDLFKLSKALGNYSLLKKETVDLMFSSKVKGYNTDIGYGVDIDLRYNQPIVGQSGGWYGVHTELLNFTHDNYTVVILSNVDDNGEQGTSMVKNFFLNLLSEN